mmetsp:Transcript_25556/g.86131  ORF Transcript_25556/g.86131 Transcript_25556/m.86131 type:complete len:435 (-) Transcript_25556:643-1947(-)
MTPLPTAGDPASRLTPAPVPASQPKAVAPPYRTASLPRRLCLRLRPGRQLSLPLPLPHAVRRVGEPLLCLLGARRLWPHVEARLVPKLELAWLGGSHQREHLELELARARLWQDLEPELAAAARTRRRLRDGRPGARELEHLRLEDGELAALDEGVDLLGRARALALASDAGDAHVLVRDEVAEQDREALPLAQPLDVDAELGVLARRGADDARLHLRVGALDAVRKGRRVEHRARELVALEAEPDRRLDARRQQRRQQRVAAWARPASSSLGGHGSARALRARPGAAAGGDGVERSSDPVDDELGQEGVPPRRRVVPVVEDLLERPAGRVRLELAVEGAAQRDGGHAVVAGEPHDGVLRLGLVREGEVVRVCPRRRLEAAVPVAAREEDALHVCPPAGGVDHQLERVEQQHLLAQKCSPRGRKAVQGGTRCEL